MGAIKYRKEFLEHFKDRDYFSAKDAELFLTQKGASKDYARLTLHKLEKKGEIKRLKRGYYSFSDNLDTIGFIFEPFYYGLQEALSLHGLWNQQTNPVVITTRKVRTGIRSVLGRNILIRHIQRKMFFGYEAKRVGNNFLPVSDLEKTLIDFVYFKAAIPKDVLEEMKKRIDKEKLQRYLDKLDKSLRIKVNNFLQPKN
ncbi:MAG: type IV toxin-antitoxin system AbiEi family antitoxin domain-containing protein [Candidatus Parvarchaeum sp.]